MSQHKAVINSVGQVTHDVKRFVVARPEGYSFTPGQATDVAVDEDGYRDEAHPFTFTSLNEDEELEFTVKIYPSHHGVTWRLSKLQPGDTLLIGEPWGAITYSGPGVFIAGGAGVTPFIAILRDLERKGELGGQTLLFSNKRADDVILREELTRMLGDRAVNTLTREQVSGYEHGRIDMDFIRAHVSSLDQPFYVCGPPAMVEDITKGLADAGVSTDSIVMEE